MLFLPPRPHVNLGGVSPASGKSKGVFGTAVIPAARLCKCLNTLLGSLLDLVLMSKIMDCCANK